MFINKISETQDLNLIRYLPTNHSVQMRLFDCYRIKLKFSHLCSVLPFCEGALTLKFTEHSIPLLLSSVFFPTFAQFCILFPTWLSSNMFFPLLLSSAFFSHSCSVKHVFPLSSVQYIFYPLSLVHRLN